MLKILQMLVVITGGWEDVEGTMYPMHRHSPEHKWELAMAPFPVNVGKSGLAWGRGEHQLREGSSMKKEGDLKGTAGIFQIGPLFGTEDYLRIVKMPFLLTDSDWEAIDDPTSSYYNQILKRSEISVCDWTSSELMFREDGLYALGIVVQHNMRPALPGAGSCIFMHRWREKGKGSAGCTVMTEENLQSIATWLDPEKSPLLVQLPIEEYRSLQKEWSLPVLSDLYQTQ